MVCTLRSYIWKKDQLAEIKKGIIEIEKLVLLLSNDNNTSKFTSISFGKKEPKISFKSNYSIQFVLNSIKKNLNDPDYLFYCKNQEVLNIRRMSIVNNESKQIQRHDSIIERDINTYLRKVFYYLKNILLENGIKIIIQDKGNLIKFETDTKFYLTSLKGKKYSEKECIIIAYYLLFFSKLVTKPYSEIDEDILYNTYRKKIYPSAK
jgi:hypothetical protein